MSQTATSLASAACYNGCGRIVPVETGRGRPITRCPVCGPTQYDPSRPPPAAPPPPPPSGSLPIGQCAGRPVRCPEPGCVEVVVPRASQARLSDTLKPEPSALAKFFYLVDCPRHGKKQWREDTLVVPMGDAPPEPAPGPRIVKCPEPGCGKPATLSASRGSGLHRGSGDWVRLDGPCAHLPKLYPISTYFEDVPAPERPAEVPSSVPPYLRGATPR